MAFRQEFLRNRPSLMPFLAGLHGREWAHLYGGDWNSGTALAEFHAQKSDGRLPATLLLLENEILLGSVSLVFDDFPGGTTPTPGLNPWLASLYVLPEHRGRGIGAELVRKAGELFAMNGFESHSLFTENRQSFFGRLGYRETGQSMLHGFPVTLMRGGHKGFKA